MDCEEINDSKRGSTGVYSNDVDECAANGRERKEVCGKGDGVTANHLPNLSKSECSVDTPTSLFMWNKEIQNLCLPYERKFLEVGFYGTSVKSSKYTREETGELIHVVIRKCLGVWQCPKCHSVDKPTARKIRWPKGRNKKGHMAQTSESPPSCTVCIITTRTYVPCPVEYTIRGDK